MFTRKLIASTVAAASLATGGLAVAALNPLSSAGAQEEQPAPEAQPAHRAARGVLGDVLDELVADSTLTQAQADAVRGGVKDELKERRRDHRRALITFVADTIGIPAEDLVAALKDGQSIADVAETNGVETQTVIDAIVARGTERIDQAVADGKLTEERAARLTERLPEAADRIVHRTREG